MARVHTRKLQCSYTFQFRRERFRVHIPQRISVSCTRTKASSSAWLGAKAVSLTEVGGDSGRFESGLTALGPGLLSAPAFPSMSLSVAQWTPFSVLPALCIALTRLLLGKQRSRFLSQEPQRNQECPSVDGFSIHFRAFSRC